MKNVFCTRELVSLSVKIRLLKCNVFSTLFYGTETWALQKRHMNKLEAFEMWSYQRILTISWVSRTTNEVLRIGKCKGILKTINS
ncbi:hypothetical protein R5R35_014755 [Gryllus longicercus]|uniref:Uncharacterized protein n=1 Tax=Gryllus longicercus TaxID=2509291 RepID=A0AAN9VMX8_9ORTH